MRRVRLGSRERRMTYYFDDHGMLVYALDYTIVILSFRFGPRPPIRSK